MTRSVVLLAVWLATTSHAVAAWRMSEYPDDVPDLPVRKYASLDAKGNASPVTARLSIGCTSYTGKHHVTLFLSERQPGKASVAWRIDRERVQHEDVPDLISSYSAASLALSPKRLARAKRVHAEWLASSGKLLSYDFDVSGAKKAMAKIPCVKSW